ncbi:hypothetical protein [Dactylosporangium aurantiacum]|uniref:hypothetical protein n=1 Tax=Dactylosporangium aurantiacum TaxID=35754 RepID=UPI0007C44A8F|nr:hypothetical protein [Dactylosporangium aurantiacum]MDG6108788.1 hypothetical protein [Dactylosporangium aurantiacum]
MPHLDDAIGRWIATATGRTLDQHATDPVPAAAHLPEAAHTLRGARAELLLAVDRLRTLLINEEDLTGSDGSFAGQLITVNERANEYRNARNSVDLLIEDQARTEYADANPARPLRRRYVNPGDTVLVVLPHTDSCRARHLAGRTARIHVGASYADVSLPGGKPVRVPHIDAGIYPDPTDGGIYVLQSTDDAAIQADTRARRIAEALLTEAIARIRRRYPTAVMAYLNHPHLGELDDGDDIILWNLTGAGEQLWPDENGEVFQSADEPGERFWLDDRDGDPYAELAEINRLLTAVYRERGAELFEPGELGGGWELPLDRP